MFTKSKFNAFDMITTVAYMFDRIASDQDIHLHMDLLGSYVVIRDTLLQNKLEFRPEKDLIIVDRYVNDGVAWVAMSSIPFTYRQKPELEDHFIKVFNL